MTPSCGTRSHRDHAVGRATRRLAWIAALLGAGAHLEGQGGPACTPSGSGLTEVAASARYWGTVAVSPIGRVFVNHPRWLGDVPFSVAEVGADGVARPYPDRRWNAPDTTRAAGERFVSVQSVHVDRDGRTLWVVDPANPGLAGQVRGGPKLVVVDLATDRVVRTLAFDSVAAPPGSYPADVRVQRDRAVAYLGDLGLGALLVVDLASGRTRRVLAGHPSTRADTITLRVGGRPWLAQDGSRP